MTNVGSAYPEVLHFCVWHSPQRHPLTQSCKGTGVRGDGGLNSRRLDGKVKCTGCHSSILAALFCSRKCRRVFKAVLGRARKGRRSAILKHSDKIKSTQNVCKHFYKPKHFRMVGFREERAWTQKTTPRLESKRLRRVSLACYSAAASLK